MNLALDMGNTAVKAGVFDKNTLLHTAYKPLQNNQDLPLTFEEIFTDFNVNRAIISSVVNGADPLIKHLNSKHLDSFVILESDTPLPVNNLYKTPETLGKDRIAGIVGGAQQFPGENILVIDIGTCITYDFLNDRNEYKGGSISPGVDLRFTAMHTFTSKLPLIKPGKQEMKDLLSSEIFIGNTTKSSLMAGVLIGISVEIDQMINIYSEKYTNIKTILTGGYSDIFESSLKNKNEIFADLNIVLKGLNGILEYNHG